MPIVNKLLSGEDRHYGLCLPYVVQDFSPVGTSHLKVRTTFDGDLGSPKDLDVRKISLC